MRTFPKTDKTRNPTYSLTIRLNPEAQDDPNLRGIIVSPVVLSKRMKALRAILATLGLYLALTGLEDLTNAHRRARLRTNDAANISAVGTVALTIVGVILAAVIGLRVLAALMPTYTSSVGAIAENFTTADWGDPTANDISPIFALVVALGGLVGAAVLAIVLVTRRKAA